MAVLHDYVCLGHGVVFESMEESPKCPHGCNTVQKVFLQPPAFNSPGTSRTDQLMRQVADSYGLTDMNNRAGAPVIRPDPLAQKRQQEAINEIQARYGNGWGKIPKPLNGGADVGAAAVLAQYGGRPDNVLEQVKPALQPRPVHRINDHENLSVNLDKAA